MKRHPFWATVLPRNRFWQGAEKCRIPGYGQILVVSRFVFTMLGGPDHIQPALMATITLETYVADDHKLRKARKIVNQILSNCQPEFESTCSKIGRPLRIP